MLEHPLYILSTKILFLSRLMCKTQPDLQAKPVSCFDVTIA